MLSFKSILGVSITLVLFTALAVLASLRISRRRDLSRRQRLGLLLVTWFCPLFGPIVILALTGRPIKPVGGEPIFTHEFAKGYEGL